MIPKSQWFIIEERRKRFRHWAPGIWNPGTRHRCDECSCLILCLIVSSFFFRLLISVSFFLFWAVATFNKWNCSDFAEITKTHIWCSLSVTSPRRVHIIPFNDFSNFPSSSLLDWIFTFDSFTSSLWGWRFESCARNCRNPREIVKLKMYWSVSNDPMDWVIDRGNALLFELKRFASKPENKEDLQDFKDFLHMFFSPAYSSGGLPRLGQVGRKE